MGVRPVGCGEEADLAGSPRGQAMPGAPQCCNCGSTQDVRRWEHGCDYCIECIDLLDSLTGEAEYGEGD
jgi:hypothetical protein